MSYLLAGTIRAFGPADFTPITIKPASKTTTRRGPAPSYRPRNPGVLQKLQDAILAQPRGSVPCLDPDPAARRLWTSDEPEDAQRAAKACARCPVRRLCRVAGRGEHAGVWGGVARGITARKTSTDEGEAA